MAGKRALLLLAEGAEEMEAIIAADVMRRAEISVTIAGLAGSGPVRCSRQVVILPDVALSDALDKGPYDVIVWPGGLAGARTIAASDVVGKLTKQQEANGGYLAAICAAPIGLKSHDVFKGKTVTSHPSVKQEILDAGLHKYSEERVVQDGKLITSRGPGTSFEFALKIVEALEGKEKSEEISSSMILP